MNTSKQQLAQKFIGTFATLKRIIHRMSCCSPEEKMATELQFQALTLLNEHRNITVGVLGRELGLSSSAVAQLTDRLAQSGRITRIQDKDDRRITHITLTEEGKKELSHMASSHLEKMTLLLSLISEEDLKEIIRIQTDLITKLENTKTL
jgi:MarR family 2-MHQ and catechol resistance regulon transcriptional repressor